MSVFRSRLLAFAIFGGAMFGCSGTRPADLGVHNGRLRPCPGSPNCVSSEDGTAADKLVRPFPVPGGHADLARLAATIVAWPRTEVISTSGEYLHAESTSLIWRFKDDVEFRFDSVARVIHVRSASRLGKGDLGANRKRVEGMRDLWTKATGGSR